MTAPHMPMMNDYGLLECPFCGSGDVHMDDELLLSQVACSSCGAQGGASITRNLAMKNWNSRNGNIYTADDFKQAGMERE